MKLSSRLLGMVCAIACSLLYLRPAVAQSPGSAPTLTNASAFVSQSVPSTMAAGQGCPVSVVFRNTGTTTWTAGASYHLGSQAPRDNTLWLGSSNRVSLPGPVAPGATATFSFTVTAPASAGSYPFQWRMVQDGVQWFGDFTPATQVTVTGGTSTAPVNAAAFVSQSVPSTMAAGQGCPVSVVFRNTGTTTWTAGASYHLGSQAPRDNTLWLGSSNRVSLPGPVAPGATATFSFTVTAPASAGSYPFQWRMVQDGVQWFGDFTPATQVTVTGGLSAPQTMTATGQWVINCPKCDMPMAHIILAWGTVTGAQQYNVYRDGTCLVTGLTAPVYTDMSVVSGQAYAYTACGVANNTTGPQSAQASATAPNPPAPTPGQLPTPMSSLAVPTNLSVHGSWQGAPEDTLTWDAVPGADSYNIYQYDQLIAKSVTGTSFAVPLGQFNASMTYTVTSVSGGMESLPSAIATAQGAQDPSQQPSWMPTAPAAPYGLIATPEWNNGHPRIHLQWKGGTINYVYSVYTYNVYRDGQKVASGLWGLNYIDGNVNPGETHQYTVSGVNVPWTTSVESAPSAVLTATALAGPPAPWTGGVQITKIVPNDDSVVVSFAPVPGAVDYRVYNVASPGTVKYSGGGLSIQMNGLDPTQAENLVVEAVDKLGPFQTMDGSMGPGSKGMGGMVSSAINGQGDPSNVPSVIATSGPFPVTFQSFALAGDQAFYDTFRGSQPLVPSTDMDPVVAATSNPWFEVNEVENDKWRVRTYGADTAMSKVFLMGNHFMDTLYDGPTAATHPFSHNNNASMVMMPKATADISGSKVLHVTFEVDGHFDGRRWCNVFVAAAGDPLVVPGKFFENNELPTVQGNLFRWENHSKVDDAQVFLGKDSGGNLNCTELFQEASGVGPDDFGPGVRITWDNQPMLNGTAQDLDKRHRFDLYLSQTHFRVQETVLGQAPVVIKDETFPNGVTLPFTNCQVYFVHQVYHTGNDRPEEVIAGTDPYWYNYRAWGDERHWDNMGFEVLPSFPN